MEQRNKKNKGLLTFELLMPLCALGTYGITSLNYCILMPFDYCIAYTSIFLISGFVAWKTRWQPSCIRLISALSIISTLCYTILLTVINIALTGNLVADAVLETFAVWMYTSIIPIIITCVVYKKI